MNGLDAEARDIALGIIDTFQEAKAKAKMTMQHAGEQIYEDLSTIQHYLNDPRNSWIGMNPVGRSVYEAAGLSTALLGKIVYHGSPHTFEKFAMSKIGTGEGAQAFGHGLYFAENPEVAKSYTGQGGIMPAATQIVQDAIKKIRANPKASASDVAWADAKEAAIASRSGNNLYTVDLPDEQIAKMLDFEKPIQSQPKEVQMALEPIMKEVSSMIGPAQLHDGRWVLFNHNSGYPVSGTQAFASKEAAQQAMDNPSGQLAHTLMGEFGKPEDVSARLRDAGIPGLRYLDAGSRGTGGTSNYVVFDDTLPKIMKRE
jgi:hypothetical protein